MYAICNVVLGWPLNTNDSKGPGWSEELEDAIESEEPGFMRFYRGGGDCIPAAFGITLCEFDECVHHTDLDGLTLTPTAQQEADAEKMFEALPKSLQTEIASKYGERMRVFILWSSS